MIETKDKAKEILDYCIKYLSYLNAMDNKQIDNFHKTKKYKEMVKEIEFMIDTD